MGLKNRLREVKHTLSLTKRKIKKLRATARKKDARAEDLADALGAAEKLVKAKRRKRRSLRHNPDFRPNWSEEKKEQRRDVLADEIEDAEDVLDELVEAAEKNQRKSKKLDRKLAKHVRRRKRLAKRRKKIREQIEAKDDKDRLSRSFVVAEFNCRDGTPVPKAAIPALRELCAKHLQPLRDSGQTVRVNSGYRHRAYNASIGGASGSYHIYDERPGSPAADHTQDGRAASAVADWHESHNPPPAMGRYSTFTHIDRRGYRSRWWG